MPPYGVPLCARTFPFRNGRSRSWREVRSQGRGQRSEARTMCPMRTSRKKSGSWHREAEKHEATQRELKQQFNALRAAQEALPGKGRGRGTPMAVPDPLPTF